MDQSLWQTPESIDFIQFIIHVITNNIVMWVILPNNADWDCFKTLTLREILRIQNPLRGEHVHILEVIRLFQSVGCVRNKLQFRTVQQNQKSSLWTLDWDSTGFLLSIYGIWSFLSLETRFRLLKDWRDPFSITRIKDLEERTNVLSNIHCVPSNVQFSHQEALLYVFDDNEAVIKMIIKGRTMRHVS